MNSEYEMMIVARGNLEEAARNDLIEQVKKLVEAQKGEIINFEELGKKKLTYSIKKNSEGFYYLFKFQGNSETPSVLNSKFKLMDELLRYLIVRKEKSKVISNK